MGVPVAWKVYVYSTPSVVVNGGVPAANAGALDAVETATVNSPMVASGRVPLLAVTEYPKLVIPVGTIPDTDPVVELILRKLGAVGSRAYVGVGVPVAVNV